MHRARRGRTPGGAPGPRAGARCSPTRSRSRFSRPGRRRRHRARQGAAGAGQACRLSIAMRSRFAEDLRPPRHRTRACGRSCGLASVRPRHLRRSDSSGPRTRGSSSLDHPADAGRERRRLAPGANRRAEAMFLTSAHHLRRRQHDRRVSRPRGLDPDRGVLRACGSASRPDSLTQEAAFATLGELASWPGEHGSRVRLRQPARSGQRYSPRCALIMSRWPSGSAASGEPVPMLFRYAPTACTLARELGFSEIEDLDRRGPSSRATCHAPPVPPRPGPGGHVVRMATA